MPTYPATQQLFRRWDVQQMFGICRSTLVSWQAAGKLTPVQVARPTHRRARWCMRKGKRVRITARGPVVLYHIDQLRALARRLLRDVPEIGAYFSPVVHLSPEATPLASLIAKSKTKTGESP